jgi:hypothetical protein
MTQAPHPRSYVTHQEFTELEEKFKQLEERHNHLLIRFNESQQPKKEENYYIVFGYSFNWESIDKKQIHIVYNSFAIDSTEILSKNELKQFVSINDTRAKANKINPLTISITSYSFISKEAYLHLMNFDFQAMK